jgi:hypothetical protein
MPGVPAEAVATMLLCSLEPAGSSLGLLEVPPGCGLLAGALPFDRAALDRALRDFLASFDTLGQTLERSLGGLGLSPWLVSVALAATAYEVGRRQKRGLAARVGLAGAPASVSTWVAGLPGSLSSEQP